jgi:hypothetical protein
MPCGLVAWALWGCTSQPMAKCPVDPSAPPELAAAGPPKACSKTHTTDDGLVDDFDDGNTQVAKVEGRDGYWFTSHDDKGSTIGPSPLTMTGEGAGGAGKSLHLTGVTSGATGAWGALWGANFAGQGAYDASKHTGMSFKAKVGGSSTQKVRFKLGDVNTHPDGGVCKDCWNHFGKDLTFSTDWKEYVVTFAEMTQEAGWGQRFPFITTSKLISVNWSVGPGVPYDVWIDDLQFVDCN